MREIGLDVGKVTKEQCVKGTPFVHAAPFISRPVQG